MTVQHTDIFHCLKCGRIDYEPPGQSAPSCCGQPMVRAVADVVKDVALDGQPLPERRPDVEEHALLADAVELSNWCRRISDVDVARYNELLQRLVAFGRALSEQFDDEERARHLAKMVVEDPRLSAVVGQLGRDREQLLASLSRLIENLDGEESRLMSWPEVCERLDSLTADFRRHEEAESELLTRTVHAGSRRET